MRFNEAVGSMDGGTAERKKRGAHHSDDLIWVRINRGDAFLPKKHILLAFRREREREREFCVKP